MLQVKNLNIVHRKDLRSMLSSFDFVLNKGDKAVIIGEEGNGKSTLLKWIYDPELVEEYAEASGERICTGERLAYLPQELSEEDKRKSVYEFFCEDALIWNQDPKQLNRMAGELGLPADFFYGERAMGTLSGGEKVKAQIARIEMMEPTVLLLDEPSNDIDIETLEWLEEWLMNTERAVLYISHDETLIERTANVVIHMEQLRRKTVSRYVVARMPYRTYVQQREAGMNNQKQQALNERRQERIQQEKLRRIQQKVEHDQNAISRQDPHSGQLLKKKMKAVKSMEHRFEREKEERTQMPETEEAIMIRFREDIRIPNGKTVLDFALEELCVPGEGEEEKRVLSEGIALRVKGSEKVCIIGKNGAGKTTLLRQIARQLLERKDIRAAYMPQNYEERMDLRQTPVDYLSVTGEKEEITRIRTYLGAMKYTADEMSHAIAELSGGQKAKLFFLKMILAEANVLILDEPTRNFSPLSTPVIRKILSAYGGAVISISHDRKYISEVCDTVYELSESGLSKK